MKRAIEIVCLGLAGFISILALSCDGKPGRHDADDDRAVASSAGERPGTEAATPSAGERPGTEAAAPSAGERPGTEAAAPSAGERPGTAATARRDGALRIPFELDRNKIILPVRVGGSRVLEVLLDTGMHFDGLLLYNRDLRDSLGMVDFMDIRVGGAGPDDASNAVLADSVTFTIGEAELSNQRIIVLQNDLFDDFPSDGVSGYSLFGHYAVEIDYDSLVITLHDPDKLSIDDSWASIPLAFKSNKIPWVEAAVNIGGEEEIAVSLYIDLASGEALEMLIRDGMRYELPPGLEEVYLGRGLSGDIDGYRGRISSLRLGPFLLRDVLSAFADARVRSKQPGADGVLANNALRRFNLVFDYANETLYLKPNGHFEEPFE